MSCKIMSTDVARRAIQTTLICISTRSRSLSPVLAGPDEWRHVGRCELAMSIDLVDDGEQRAATNDVNVNVSMCQ